MARKKDEASGMRHSPSQSRLVGYYSGETPDDQGRYLTDIQRWNDDQLEGVHDFIQWMFPLRERSGVNAGAPILDEFTVQQFRSRPDLREMLKTSLARMLAFYGLELNTEGIARVVQRQNFAARSRNWLWPGNHNHLRITRIIKSLKALGLEAEADAFFACLSLIYEAEKEKTQPGITARTYQFWREAALSSR